MASGVFNSAAIIKPRVRLSSSREFGSTSRYFGEAGLFSCIYSQLAVYSSPKEHMRPTITWLLVLVIGSMLVSTAFAECAAMNMPCCSEHRSTNCHEICAPPTGNISSATVPQFSSEIQAVATLNPTLSIPHLVARQIQPSLATSSENLLLRIHVLLI